MAFNQGANPFLTCGISDFPPVNPRIPPPQIQFQQNQPVSFTNIPPPSLQCSPAAFPNRPAFLPFGPSVRPVTTRNEACNSQPFQFLIDKPPPFRPEIRPITAGNEPCNSQPFQFLIDETPLRRPEIRPITAGNEPSNSQPFQFLIDKPPPLRPDISFPRLSNMNSLPFRPTLDRPPPPRLNFSGSANQVNPPAFNQRFNRPPFFAQNNSRIPEPSPSNVSNTHPNLPSVQMKPRFSSGSTFKQHFSPRNQNPPYSQRSPFQSNARPCETSPEKTSFNNMKRKRFKNFKEKDFRKIKDYTDNTHKPFSCDTCDRAFSLNSELDAHLSEHIKCTAYDCNFEAHPKIVALHQKMQHDTGYAAAINKLQNAEEIEKWRAERRKRFPTAENVQKKKAEQAEKEARGEILETKEFGKFKRGSPDQKDLVEVKNNRFSRIRRKYGRHSSRNSFSSRKKRFQHFENVVYVSSDSDDDSHIHLKKFCGLPSLENCITLDDENENSTNIFSSSNRNLLLECKQESLSNDIDSRIVDIHSSQESLQTANVLSDNAISSEIVDLEERKQISVGNSVSSIEVIRLDDSEDDPPDEIPTVKDLSNVNLIPDSTINKSPVLENSKKEGDKAVAPFHNNKQESFKRNPVNLPKKSSLLEKLLADDIRRERNVILQCIHYIVKNNYFGFDTQNVKL